MRRSVFLAAAAAAIAAAPASGQLSEEQQAAIAGDPGFERQQLKLVDVPAPAGPHVSLFNGRDLDDWETWLGYEDPLLTYFDDPARPLQSEGAETYFRNIVVDPIASMPRIEMD